MNKTLRDILAKEITNQPDTIQFAKDRKYEDAWIINKKAGIPTEEEIKKYLNDDFKILIVEFIWNTGRDDSPFVLTIFLGDNCKVKDNDLFIKGCLKLFFEYQDFATFINKYDADIIGHKFLLESPIEGVRLGVFNHWLSIGPIDLWNSGEKLNIAEIGNKIKARSEVEKSELNFQGLLFTINNSGKYQGPFHGIKTPCCKKEGNIWVVDYPKVEYWMRTLLAIN